MDTNAIVTGIALTNILMICVIPLAYYLNAVGMKREKKEDSPSSAGHRNVLG